MSYAGGTRTVDVHVAQLRRKLGRPDAIRTVPGLGLQGHPAVRLQRRCGRGCSRRSRSSRCSRWPWRSRSAPLLTRRAVERNTLRDVSAQFDLLVEREREAILPFSRLRSLQEFLERQDERVVQVPLDGSSAAPAAGARGRSCAAARGSTGRSRRTARATSTRRGSSAGRASCCCARRARRTRRGGRTSRA